MGTKTAKAIVDELGGVMQLARDLNIPFTTVSGWVRLNSIPTWRQPALLQLAITKNVSLSTADFPTEEQRISRADLEAERDNDDTALDAA